MSNATLLSAEDKEEDWGWSASEDWWWMEAEDPSLEGLSCRGALSLEVSWIEAPSNAVSEGGGCCIEGDIASEDRICGAGDDNDNKDTLVGIERGDLWGEGKEYDEDEDSLWGWRAGDDDEDDNLRGERGRTGTKIAGWVYNEGMSLLLWEEGLLWCNDVVSPLNKHNKLTLSLTLTLLFQISFVHSNIDYIIHLQSLSTNLSLVLAISMLDIVGGIGEWKLTSKLEYNWSIFRKESNLEYCSVIRYSNHNSILSIYSYRTYLSWWCSEIMILFIL